MPVRSLANRVRPRLAETAEMNRAHARPSRPRGSLMLKITRMLNNFVLQRRHRRWRAVKQLKPTQHRSRILFSTLRMLSINGRVVSSSLVRGAK